MFSFWKLIGGEILTLQFNYVNMNDLRTRAEITTNRNQPTLGFVVKAEKLQLH